jgi:hypothetical protein
MTPETKFLPKGFIYRQMNSQSTGRYTAFDEIKNKFGKRVFKNNNRLPCKNMDTVLVIMQAFFRK